MAAIIIPNDQLEKGLFCGSYLVTIDQNTISGIVRRKYWFSVFKLVNLDPVEEYRIVENFKRIMGLKLITEKCGSREATLNLWYAFQLATTCRMLFFLVQTSLQVLAHNFTKFIFES